MNRHIIAWVSATSLLLIVVTAQPAEAISISIVPSNQSVVLGSSATLDIMISGLGEAVAPSLGAFDVTVSFDPGLLAFSNATYGDPIRGDQLDLFGLGSIFSTTPGIGSVNLFELSLDAASDLDLLQAADFILVRLTFNAIAVGTSGFGLTVLALSDGLGAPLIASVIDGSVSVVARSAPEPMILVLMTMAATAVTVRRLKARR